MTNKSITLNPDSPIFIRTILLLCYVITATVIGLALQKFYSESFKLSSSLNSLISLKTETSVTQINYKQFKTIEDSLNKPEILTIPAKITPIIR
ncbi:MAG: hypothetical protein WCG01_02935 [bacterium]